MNQKQLIQLKSEIIEQVNDYTPDKIIDTIVKQIIRSKDASDRIEKEGLVVRDMKGAVIPHPAIQIEINAQKIYCDLLGKNKKMVKRKLFDVDDLLKKL